MREPRDATKTDAKTTKPASSPASSPLILDIDDFKVRSFNHSLTHTFTLSILQFRFCKFQKCNVMLCNFNEMKFDYVREISLSMLCLGIW
jgi:hypothetical protein